MQGAIRGFVLLDVAGSAALNDRHLRAVRDAFEVGVAAVQSQLVEPARVLGDGALLVFQSPHSAWECIGTLVSTWRRAAVLGASPLGVGLRIGLAAGTFHSSSEDITQTFSTEMPEVYRVLMAGRPGTVVVTSHAMSFVRDTLDRTGIAYVARHGDGTGAKHIPEVWYEIDLDALLGRGRCLVEVRPPADLIMFLAAHPNELRRIPPRTFEEVTAELLHGFGYEVQLTKQTRDGGYDILAVRRGGILDGEERYLVECKRYAEADRVDVTVVRALLGVGEIAENTGLILATTSSFTEPARALARSDRTRWRLHLRDYDDIVAWVAEYKRLKG